MFDFNNKANGIFSDGFTDRDGKPTADTFIYRLRAKLLGRAGQNFSRDQNAAFAQKFSSREMAAIMNDDPTAPHIRVEYDRNYYGGPFSSTGDHAMVPAALVDALNGDVPAAFEMMVGLDRVHVMHFSSDEYYDVDGENIYDSAEVPFA